MNKRHKKRYTQQGQRRAPGARVGGVWQRAGARPKKRPTRRGTSLGMVSLAKRIAKRTIQIIQMIQIMQMIQMGRVG